MERNNASNPKQRGGTRSTATKDKRCGQPTAARNIHPALRPSAVPVNQVRDESGQKTEQTDVAKCFHISSEARGRLTPAVSGATPAIGQDAPNNQTALYAHKTLEQQEPGVASAAPPSLDGRIGLFVCIRWSPRRGPKQDPTSYAQASSSQHSTDGAKDSGSKGGDRASKRAYATSDAKRPLRLLESAAEFCLSAAHKDAAAEHAQRQAGEQDAKEYDRTGKPRESLSSHGYWHGHSRTDGYDND